MTYGYARVSSTDQNLDRQLEVLKGFNCDVIYTDKMSGKDFNRDEYKKLKSSLKSGDLLYIKSIDRLGRNYDMIIDEWRDITHNIGADIIVVDMPLLDTRDKEKGLTGKFISDLVLQILSYVAETERNNIKQRQAEGIKIAKQKGVHMGRPKYELPNNFFEVAKDLYDKKISLLKALEQTKMKKATFFKFANKNGFRRLKKSKLVNEKPIYIIKSEHINKMVLNKKRVCEELKISSTTLGKYFRGENTIINKLGVIVEKVEDKGE